MRIYVLNSLENLNIVERAIIINWVKMEYPSIWKRIWELYESDAVWVNRIGENWNLPKIKKRKPFGINEVRRA